MNSESIRAAEQELFSGHPALIGSLGRLAIAIFSLGIGALYFWLETKTTKYRVTTQRVVVETGWFDRKIDAIELYLVDDIRMEQPFGQRLMGTGNMILITRDRSTPQVHLDRIAVEVTQLYESMRPHIEESKYRHRLMREDMPRG
jgi:uncharacterized membrane protein YdbT with pleckstrin-like domain